MSNKKTNHIIKKFWGNKEIKKISILISNYEVCELTEGLHYREEGEIVYIKRNVLGYDIKFEFSREGEYIHTQIFCNEKKCHSGITKEGCGIFKFFKIEVDECLCFIKLYPSSVTENNALDETYNLRSIYLCYESLFSDHTAKLNLEEELLMLIYNSNFANEELMNTCALFIFYTIQCGYDEEIHSFLKDKMKHFGYDENYIYNQDESILSAIVNSNIIDEKVIKSIMKEFLKYSNTICCRTSF